MMKIMMIFFYDFIYEAHPVPGLEYNVPALVRLWVEARIAGRCKDVHAARIQLKLLLLPRLFRPTIQTSCKTFQIHCLLRIHLCPNQNLTSCSLVIFWCRCGEVIHFCLAHIQMVVMRPDLKICCCGYFIKIQFCCTIAPKNILKSSTCGKFGSFSIPGKFIRNIWWSSQLFFPPWHAFVLNVDADYDDGNDEDMCHFYMLQDPV